MLFGEDGLRLNIARYNIGGGNAPDVRKDYMKTGATMDGFWKAPEGTTRQDMDWWNPDNPGTLGLGRRRRYSAGGWTGSRTR